MTTYFSSDFHFSHANIILYCRRPFANIDEMNFVLIKQFNSVVGKDDSTYIVGDFSLSEKAVPIFLPRLNGKKILISGNHDKTFIGHKKHDVAIKRYLEYGFEEVLMETRIGPFLVNHLPYETDERHGDKYASYHPKNNGSWLVHGHCHGSMGRVHGRQIDVGVDCNDYKPVSLEALLELANLKG